MSESEFLIKFDAVSAATLGSGPKRPHCESGPRFEEFFAVARDAVAQLPHPVRAALETFRKVGGKHGALLLKGYQPLPDLPLTPPHSTPADLKTADLGQFAQCVIAAALGEPVCYAEEKGGVLFQDVSPTRVNQDATSSQSSRSELEFHTEMVFHPAAPDFLLLLALRQDRERAALTSFSCAHDFLADLDSATLHQLSRLDYRFALDRLHSPYHSRGVPVSEITGGPRFSVLNDYGVDPCIRFEPELTVSCTAEAADALKLLSAAIHRNRRSVALEPGDILILDNRRAVHARSSFRARHDGADRWLRRVHVRRELPAAGRRIAVDLLEGWAG